MKAVKILAAAAAALVGTAAFADGFTAGGYIRTGVEAVIIDPDVDGVDPYGIFKTAADDKIGYHGGHNLGLGADRIRLNLAYSKGDAGVKFRYQQEDFTGDWLTADNVKYAFAYANLFDKLLTVEAGKLNGGYTATHGDEEYAFGGRTGARLAVFPFDGLAFDVTASTKYLGTYSIDTTGDGNADYKPFHLTSDAFAVSAAYKVKDSFGIQAGYALKGEGYVGFDLFAVENLNFAVEAKYLDKDISKAVDKEGKAVNGLAVTETVSYKVNSIKAGIVAKQNLTEDNGALSFYPFVSVGLDNVLEGLSAGIDAGYVTGAQAKGADIEDIISVTPEVTFTVTENGKVQLYYTFSKKDETLKHALGLGVRYDF